MVRENSKWLGRLFTSHFWLGVLLVFLSVLLQSVLQNKNFLLDAAIAFIQTIGVAIVVAVIFSYTAGTAEFLDKVTTLLKSIVIDRNFLANIDIESKRSALVALIKPSEAERQRYAYIGRYYDIYINHTLNITKKCVRSDYRLEARAYNDSSGVVSVEQRISYRLHPTIDGFTDVTLRLDDQEKGSCYKWVRVSDSDGNVLIDKLPEPKSVLYRGNNTAVTTIPLKELGKGKDHLIVQWCIIERGYDHWIHLTFQALEPTDGFEYYLSCEEDINVWAFQTFVHGADFKVYQEGSKSIEISCHEWFNEGTGLSIVVSKTPPFTEENIIAEQSHQANALKASTADA